MLKKKYLSLRSYRRKDKSNYFLQKLLFLTFQNNYMLDYSKSINEKWNEIVYSYETGGRKVPKKFTVSSATEIFFDIFNKTPTAKEKKYFIKEINEYAKLWHIENQ